MLREDLLGVAGVGLLGRFELLRDSSEVARMRSDHLGLLVSLRILRTMDITRMSAIRKVRLLAEELSIAASILRDFLRSVSATRADDLSRYSIVDASIWAILLDSQRRLEFLLAVLRIEDTDSERLEDSIKSLRAEEFEGTGLWRILLFSELSIDDL